MSEYAETETLLFVGHNLVVGHNFRPDVDTGRCRFCDGEEQGHGIEMRQCRICLQLDSELLRGVCGTCAEVMRR